MIFIFILCLTINKKTKQLNVVEYIVETMMQFVELRNKKTKQKL